MAERLARAEEWIEGHEKRCEDRQVAMGREIRDLKTTTGQQLGELKAATGLQIGELKTATTGLAKGAWGVVLAIAAWAAMQLYSDLKRPAAPPHSTAVTVTAPQR